MDNDNGKTVDWSNESWVWLRESPFVAAVNNGNDIADQCEAVNGSWAAHVFMNGLASVVETVDCFALSGGDVPEGYAHTVAVLDGVVWDWSCRQFDDDTDVPMVVPMVEWEQQWRVGSREPMTAGRVEEIMDEWEDVPGF